jgi:undecaprenyl-diphosphatase
VYNEAMRAYVPFYLAINYIVFAFAASLGMLQAAAVSSGDRRLAVLAWPDHPRASLAIAGLWIAGVYAIFWFRAPELLTPGPAGAELTEMFGLSALLALGVTRLLAWLRSNFKFQISNFKFQGHDFQPSPLQASNMRHPIRNRQYAIYISLYILLSIIIGLFDLPLFQMLNGLAGHTAAFDSTIQFFMNDYIVPTALVLTLLGLWFAGKPSERATNQSVVLRALLAFALASVVLKLINEVYFRPRPFTDYKVTLLFYHPSDSSFPSNAATVGFSLGTGIWLRRKKWGAWMLALAAAMAVARVCGGVHFPLDIVAGAWLGGLSAWVVNRIVWLDGPIERVIQLAQRLTLA